MNKIISLLLRAIKISGVVSMPKELKALINEIMLLKDIKGASIKKAKSLINQLPLVPQGKKIYTAIQGLKNRNEVVSLLSNNPRQAMEYLNQLSPKAKRYVSNLLSGDGSGPQVFLASSWIEWAIWEPVDTEKNIGTLIIKTKMGSKTNPSGIYQFPLHGHPHGYGSYVPRLVYEMIKISASAGITFWQIFYRKWYNTHRRIGYKQKERKNGK